MIQLTACFVILVITIIPVMSLKADAGDSTLRGAYAESFNIGAAIPAPGLLNEKETLLLTKHFSSITPENLMKPKSIQPHEGEFDFQASDRFVDDARKLGLQIHGHTLVWHSQSPEWFFEDKGKLASREIVLQRMKNHITQLVGRYKERIDRWDVVNEAIAGDDSFLRDSKWQKITGEDFIIEAFLAARRADPKAQLYYNDFNIEYEKKREKAVRLIKLLKERGSLIDGIGIQGHWEIDKVPFDDIEKSIIEFHSLGIRVAITELDLDVVPRRNSGADISATENDDNEPYPGSLPADVQQRQAEQYARLFQIFNRHADKIDVITFWGLHDGRTWLNKWPRVRTNHPLFWNRALEPKPAFQAVIDAARR